MSKLKFYTYVKKYGNNILYSGYTDSGEQIHQREKYSPTFFIPTKENYSKYTTIYNEYVKPIKFETIEEANQFREKYKDYDDFKIYGMERFEYAWISDTFKNIEIDYDFSKLRILNFDIETDSSEGFPDSSLANQTIQSITCKYFNEDVRYVWGIKDEFNPSSNSKNIVYKYCETEKELLESFVEFWSGQYPDIITGWNVEGFDIPYVINRISNIYEREEDSKQLLKKLSPYGIVKSVTRRYFPNLPPLETYEIYGVSILDYITIYKKFTYKNHEKYTLDQTAFDELGKQKLDYEEYGNLRKLFEENYQLFIDYNIEDVDLVEELNNKCRIMELVIDMAYDSKINFTDPYFQVRMWDVLCFNHLREKNKVIPPRKSKNKVSFPGGYVKEPITGKYEWVVSFDLVSLYPSIIMQNRLSPETISDSSKFSFDMDFIDEMLKKTPLDHKDNEAYMPNHVKFRNDKNGFISDVIERFFNKRISIKNEMKKNIKILEKIKEEKEKRNM